MSQVLTSLTLSKRKLIACLSSAGTVAVGALLSPRPALAENMNAELDTKGIDISTATKLMGEYEKDPGVLSVLVFVSSEGTIKAHPVTGAGKEVQQNQANYQLPEPRTTLASADLHIEVFNASPTHLYVGSGGDSVCYPAP
jgi:hypothetical protein